MTDDDRKLLTEFLGETWHEPTALSMKYPDFKNSCVCGAEGWPEPCKNRTFTSPTDVFEVKDKIVEMGLWREFENAAYHTWLVGEQPAPFGEGVASYISWIFRTVNEQGEPHFCQLVADWWKTRKGE